MSCTMLRLPAKFPALINHRHKSINKDVTSLGLSFRNKTISNLNSNSKFRQNLGRCKCQLADLAPATAAAYGALLLGGGLFAFNKSGSKGSLFGGLTGAALMAAAYFLMQSQETKTVGDALGFGSALLFSSVFGIRLAATRKLIPSSPLLGLSIGALAVFISAYLHDKSLIVDLVN